MRFWPRRPSEAPPRWGDLLALEALLRDQVEDVLAVEQRQVWGTSIALGGRLRLDPERAVDRLRERLAPYGYTPFLRAERGLSWLHVLPRTEVVSPPNPLVNVGLFLCTVVTTILSGTLLLGGVSPAELMVRPSRILVGLPFAASLLAILGIHELGHYTFGRRHGIPMTLPYFIPVPPVPPFLLGTLGALIRLRGAVRDRRGLFDMAVAGPLAGLLVAVPIYAIGLRLSSVVQMPTDTAAAGSYVQFGDAILPKLIERLVLGVLPPDHDILLHPVGVAAWFGFFVTALNLIPAGQLDGGHIVYALVGRRHALISKLAVAALVLVGLAFGTLNWLVWAVLIVTLMGFRHNPTMNDITPLDPRRRALGIFALILLFLLLPPVPLSIR